MEPGSYANFLLQNHSNFKKTGLPIHFRYYTFGSWVDFAPEVAELIQAGFEEGKSMIELGVEDGRFLFDMWRMIQVDLESGEYRSISWTNVRGKCFFPKTLVDKFEVVGNIQTNPIFEVLKVTEEEDSLGKATIGIEIRVREDSILSKRKRGDLETGGPSNVGLSRWPNTRLLDERERSHQIVKNLFMSGIGFSEPNIKIIAIRQCICSDPMDKARRQVYSKQVEITRASRGDAKETSAWHGTSAQRVDNILSYGFTVPSKVYGSHSHGIGVYLSPMRSPHMSAMLSEVDDHGEKHLVLCRMIMGKHEKIEAGSQQRYPSSVYFDTGVDDLQNPKWHVMWCAYMNTHIIPQYVVSYKMT